ncbi:CoA transferase [Chelatococcus reniformis]|uniref:CoA transferase n=1 Tax=Chelatococcus reniformis TaxID=1494448 RepID=A0A916XAL6_9HYPH|nr:CoA transferase [Chelatococcus reniformis]GGC57499.1 CoA transferase [Chelatococcus reniformis]
MSGWLAPYRAVDLTDERGLLAGQMLAKLGMDVIQVEPPRGSHARQVAPFDEAGRSFYWSAFAAGKRGVTLDVEQPDGRELLLRLVDRADFLFETARPGRLAELGLSYDILRVRNPRLVHVSITPFGSDGPKRDYADAELILWAAGGPLVPNRDAEGQPLRISVPQAYLHGAADAAAGAMIAHFARLQSGRGQHVDISVQQSVTQATLASHLAAAVGHPDFSFTPAIRPANGPKALDLSGSGARTRRSKWIVRDGLVEMHLGLGPAAGDKANNFFAWMKEEGALPAALHDWDWVKAPQRIMAGEASEDDLDLARAAVAEFLAHRSKADLLAEALKRRVLLAPINDIGDLLASEQLAARGFFVAVEEDGRPRTLPGAFAFGAADMFAPPRGAPTLGQDNESVFGELLGVEGATLAGLRQRGVI